MSQHRVIQLFFFFFIKTMILKLVYSDQRREVTQISVKTGLHNVSTLNWNSVTRIIIVNNFGKSQKRSQLFILHILSGNLEK